MSILLIRIKNKGFTLIELLLAIAIMAILVSIAQSSYRSYIDKANTSKAIANIAYIALLIERYKTENNALPPDLNTVNAPTDPWDTPYQYLDMSTVMGNGAKRKDKNLVPLNTDYDLYSKGADGKSASPLTSAKSQDDIVRANNGGFIGKAENY
ncbi:MAG: prepilin-type cleavage/methylation domain-containing protein [Methylophaga sp.]|nr:MAG: prepilin-type cleavage/methylation domain-containing protein [Methylophaga sp.]